MMNTNPDSSSWMLRTRPTLKRWIIEIREIVAGEREDYIERFGSAPGYVKSLLFNSPRRSTAEFFFDEALRRVVQAWQPAASSDLGRDLRILHLLGAYTPDDGLGKVIELLSALNALDARGGNERTRRLKPAVLQALERYFPVEPSRNNAFEEYIDQLAVNLGHSDYAIYAAGRLRRLRRLDVSDERLRTLLAANSQILAGLLSVFLSERQSIKRDLVYITDLYRHYLRAAKAQAHLPQAFESALKPFGYRLTHDDRSGPHLESNDFKEPLVLADDDRAFYTLARLRSLEASSAPKMQEIARQAQQEDAPVSYELEAEFAER